MHPLKCGCRGCWRLVGRRDEPGAGCLSCRPGLRATTPAAAAGGCGPALRRAGCLLPALRSISCLSCDPSVRSVGSTCSFCSSDPIVGSFDPRGPRAGGDLWPDRMSKAKAPPPPLPPQPPVILDCRDLVEFTKSHLQGAISLGWAEGPGRGERAKLTVFDLLASRQARRPREPPGPEPRARSPAKAVAPHSLRLLLDPEDEDSAAAASQGDGGETDGAAPGSKSPRPQGALDGTSGGPVGDPLAATPLTPDIENAEISPILPFLYLGNERDAQDMARLRQLNVGYVINVTTHLPLYHAQAGTVRYKRLPATDNSKQNLQQYFEEAFEFIEEAHQSGKGVLVHCQAGVSRSATLVIAYLMKHTLMTMTDAYKYVKGKRPVISPNLNFMGQLLEFEMDLNKGLTPRILTPKLTGLETEV